MFGNNLDFPDYLDLRRQTWRRFPSVRIFILHLVVFVVSVTILLLEATYRPRAGQLYLHFVNSDVGKLFVFWAALIALHGFIAWWRSGLRAGQRRAAVDVTLDEYFQADTSLTDLELFFLHKLLDEDTQRKAKVLVPAIYFTFFNVVVWVISGAVNIDTSLTWQVTPFASLPFLAWMLILAAGRRLDENRISRRQPKHKNEKRKHTEALPRLTNDGELIDFPDWQDAEVKAKYE